MGTYSLKPADVKREWILVDAEKLVLGRLAAVVAGRLRGKYRANYTPHVDSGDHVVIINADKVALTGQKLDQSAFYWHTGYPGGIKSHTARQTLEGKFPERLIMRAVKRMLPKNNLARDQLTRLRICAGVDHPHAAQAPTLLDVAAMNSKNIRSE